MYVDPKVQKLVDLYKKKHPHLLGNTDEEIYGELTVTYPDLPPNPYSYENQFFVYDHTTPTHRDIPLDKADTSPTWGKSAIELTSPATWFVDPEENKFMAHTINNSMSGLAYTAMYGKEPYEIGDYEPGLIGEIGSFFIGLANPLDLGLFVLSGFGGGKVAGTKLAQSWIGKEGRKAAINSTVARGVAKETAEGVNRTYWKTFARGAATETGASLGIYSAAGGALAETARQSKAIKKGEQDDFELQDVIWQGTKAGLEGAALGYVGGGLTGGYMAPTYSKLKQKANPTFSDKALKLVNSPLGQVGAEAGVFSAGQIGLHALNTGEFPKDWEEVLETYMHNIGIIGGLRTFGRIAGTTNDSAVLKRMQETSKTLKEQGLDSNANAQRIYENVAETFATKEVLGKSLELQKEQMAKEQGMEYAIKGLEKFEEGAEFFAIESNLRKFQKAAEKKEKNQVLNKEEQKIFDLGVDTMKNSHLVQISWNMANELMQSPNLNAITREGKVVGFEGKTIDMFRDMAGIEKGKQLSLDDTKLVYEYLKNYTDSRLKFIEEKNELFSGARKTDKGLEKGEVKAYGVSKEALEAGVKITDIEAPSRQAQKEGANYTIRIEDNKGKTISTINEKNLKDIIKTRNELRQKISEKAQEPSLVKEEIDVAIPTEKVPTEAAPKTTKEQGRSWLEELAELEGVSEKIIAKDYEGLGQYSKENPKGIAWSEVRKDLIAARKSNRKGEGTLFEDMITSQYKESRKRRLDLYGDKKEGIDPIKDSSALNKDYIKQEDINTRNEINKWESKNNINLEQHEKLVLHEMIRGWETSALAKSTVNSYKSEAKRFLKWMKENGVDIMRDMNSENVMKYIDGTLKPISGGAFSSISSVLASMDKFKGADYMKPIKADVKLSRQNIEALEQKWRVPDDIDFVKLVSENLQKDFLAKGDEGTFLAGMLGLTTGIRVDEIPKLTSKNFKKTKDGWVLDYREGDAGKGTTLKVTGQPIHPELGKRLSTWLDGYTINNKGKKVKNTLGSEQTKNVKKMFDNIFEPQTRTLKGKEVKMTADWTSFRRHIASKILEASLNPKAPVTREMGRVFLRHDFTKLFSQYAGTTSSRYRKMLEPLYEFLNKNVEVPQSIETSLLLKGKASTEANMKALVEWHSGRIPGLKVHLDKTPGAKTYLGKLSDGTISLVLGKSNERTYFHEVFHGLEQFARGVGNKDLQRDIKNLYKMNESYLNSSKGKSQLNDYMVKYKTKSKAVKEFTADMVADWAAGKSIKGGIGSRISQFARKIITKIKQTLFGKSSLNRKDLQGMLGEQIFQGFDSRGISMSNKKPQYQFGTVSQGVKAAREKFKKVFGEEKFTTEEKKALESQVASAAGIEDAPNFRISETLKDQIGYLSDLQKYVAKLDELPMDKVQQMKEPAQWIGSWGRSKKIKEMANITDNFESNMLQIIGVPTGRIADANLKQMKKLESIYTKYGFGKELSHFDKTLLLRNLEPSEASKLMDMPIVGDTVALVAPVETVFKKLGMRGHLNKMYNHIVAESSHIGRSLVKFEDSMIKGYTRKRDGKKFKGWGDMMPQFGMGKWKKVREHLPYFDKNGEIFFEWKNKGKLPKGAEKFFNDAIKKEWFDTVKDGKGANLRERNPDGSYKWISDTREGMTIEKYIEFTDYFEPALRDVTRDIMTESQYNNFWKEKGADVKWITDGIYVSRKMRKEFQDMYNANDFSIKIEKEAEKIAVEMSMDKYKKEPSKLTEKQREELFIQAKGAAEAKFNEAARFNESDFSIWAMNPRSVKFPEFWKDPITGKEMQVYERSYDGSIMAYALGMSKMMANVEWFPSVVKFGKNKRWKEIFRKGDSEIEKIRLADPKWGKYLAEQTERQLGIYERGHYGALTGTMDNYAKILAKLGLSFPTSGLKNLIVGSPQTVAAFGMWNFFKGITETLSADNRRYVKSIGATEMGLKHIKGGKIVDVFETPFKFGLMRPTENINRYIAVLASRAEQRRLVETIRSPLLEGTNKFKKAERRLKEFYEVSPEEFSLLKKYGLDGVEQYNFKGTYEKLKTKRAMDLIERKMNTMAHVRTQGASIGVFMPEVWSRTGIKPLTLYKRMAYAATVNTGRNMKVAIKNGELMRLANSLLVTYAGGASLMGIYDKILGTSPPQEKGSFWDNFYTILWKGEFLGLLSDFLNPKGPFEGFEFSMYPALYQNLTTGVMNIIAVKEGTKFKAQAFEDYARKTWQGYDKALKIKERTSNPLEKSRLRFHKLYQQFDEEVMKNKRDGEWASTTRSPYYRALKTNLIQGTSEDFARAYITALFTIATEEYQKGISVTGKPVKSQKEALKSAMRSIKTSIRYTNPNAGGSIFKKSGESKKRSLIYIKWVQQAEANGELPKGTLKKIIQSEKDWKKRHDEYMKSIPYYMRKFGLADLLKL